MTDQRNAQSSGLTFCEYVNRHAASTGYPPTDSPQVKSELLPDASKPVYGLWHGCCELLANIWKPEKMKTIQGSCLSHEPCIRLNWSPTISLAKSRLRSYENAGRRHVQTRAFFSLNNIKHINWEIKNKKIFLKKKELCRLLIRIPALQFYSSVPRNIYTHFYTYIFICASYLLAYLYN